VTTDEEKQFGENVRHVRATMDMTQLDLAAALGKSQQWLGKVEAGGLAVSLKDALAIAEELGVPLSRLLPLEPGHRRSQEPSERAVLLSEIRLLRHSIAKQERQRDAIDVHIGSEQSRLASLQTQLGKLENKKRKG